MDIATYLAANILIADINNERTTKNSTYKQNLIKLNKLVLYQFTEDTVVIPKESSVLIQNEKKIVTKIFFKKKWFGYFADGDLGKLLRMEDLPIYKEDWIGLKTLDQANKLIFGKCPGDHMQITLPWFTENVITPYLNNTI